MKRQALSRLLRQLEEDPHLVRQFLDLVIDDDTYTTSRELSARAALKVLGENKVIADYLIMKLKTSPENVRAGAARALSALPQLAAVRLLKHCAMKDKNLLVRMYCISALRYVVLDHPRYSRQFLPVFLKAIGHRSEKIRGVGYDGLHLTRLPKAAKALRGALKDPDPNIRAAASICYFDEPEENVIK